MNEHNNEEPRASAIQVTIVAEERGTEIVLIDHHFNMVAVALGKLEKKVLPGIYKARFKAGDRMHDELFEVNETPVTIQGPALWFSSPIPLSQTSNNHEYQYYPSRQLAGKIDPSTLGIHGDAALFVFVRNSNHQLGDPWEQSFPWDDLVLRDQNGEHLASVGSHADEHQGFAALSMSLVPGVYFLSHGDPWGSGVHLQLPVALCSGWATHVYLDARPTDDRDPRNGLADLGDAAVMLLRVDDQQPLNDKMARLTELARQHHARGRRSLSDEDINDLLSAKSAYPMLGLYAAHALLDQSIPDFGRVVSILDMLDGCLTSGHPDVDLLRAYVLNQMGHVPPTFDRKFVGPPTMAASWDLARVEWLDLGLDWDFLRPLSAYRVTGSMWACLLRPLDSEKKAEEGGLGEAEPTVSAQKGLVLEGGEFISSHRFTQPNNDFIDELSESIDSETSSNEKELSEAEPTVSTRKDHVSEGGELTRSHRFASLNNDFIGELSESIDPTLVLEELFDEQQELHEWKLLRPALDRPDPTQSPFQQALRRRLLDAMNDDDIHMPLNLAALATAFQMTPDEARASYERLKRRAHAQSKVDDQIFDTRFE